MAAFSQRASLECLGKYLLLTINMGVFTVTIN